MATLTKNHIEYYKTTELLCNDKDFKQNMDKYKNLQLKFDKTVTIHPEINKKKIATFKLPENENNDIYLHNIRVENNKNYIDWSLQYYQNFSRCDIIPGKLFNTIQKLYNVTDSNILPFDITTNNYLPVLSYFSQVLIPGMIEVYAKNTSRYTKDIAFNDLSISVDVYTLDTQKYTINSDDYLINKNIGLEKVLKETIDNYNKVLTKPFYPFEYRKICNNTFASYDIKKINKTYELNLQPHIVSQSRQNFIIIYGNNNKLSNLKLYLSKAYISDICIEEYEDNIFVIKLCNDISDGIELSCNYKDTVITCYSDTDLTTNNSYDVLYDVNYAIISTEIFKI